MALISEKRALIDEVSIPMNINSGLTCPTPDFLTTLFGKPREKLSQECQPVTHKALAALMQTANVGPFAVTGLRAAVESLRRVMDAIRVQQPDVYAKLGTAGMLCCRMQRGSATKISSHSWGTAIDLKLAGKLDVRGNQKVHHGLTLIAPIFNRHGWFWGAGFRTEDAMHFEVSKNKLQEWKTILSPSKGKGIPARHTILSRGDKGQEVRVLQKRLTQLGAHLIPDGHFGIMTEQEVKIFQARHKLKPDGVVGPKTMKALGMLP
jgi:hypothetical protein